MSALVVGGSGGIGLALTERWLLQGLDVAVVTRMLSPALNDLASQHPQLNIMCCDTDAYSTMLPEWLNTHRIKPAYIAVCAGFLHQPSHLPEKRLQEVDRDFLMENITINCLSTVLLTQALERVYGPRDRFNLGVLSAKVASISDNHLGGWYSYRMSKATLNMFIRTLSIEWQRTFANACILSIHPGTTDTGLSRPFQRNIPKSRLFGVDLTAARISTLIENASPKETGRFLNWDGNELPW